MLIVFKGLKPELYHSRKKREPRNPVPPFFSGKTRKILKIRKNAPKVKFFEQFRKVPKYSDKFGKILVRPKKGGEKRERGPHLILVQNSGKILKIQKNTLKIQENTDDT